MHISWLRHYEYILPMSGLVGLNRAYGSIVRRGKQGRSYCQRYLIPDAKTYKESWKSIFRFDDLLDPLPDWNALKENEKPLLAMKFSFLYPQDKLVASTGKINGIDTSNGPKLIEDAFCEYAGVDDARTLYLFAEKLPYEGSQALVRFSVGHISTDILAETDHETRQYFLGLEQRTSGMSELYKADLPTLTAYVYLPAEQKDAVDLLLKEHSSNDQVLDAMKVGMAEFGPDAGMILTCVGLMTKKGHLSAGLWEKLVPLMEGTPEKAKESPPRSRVHRKTIKEDMRGKLPFAKLPQSKETRDEFLVRWEKRNSKKKKYPADMIDRNTGEINWDADEVYTCEKGAVDQSVYKFLIEGKHTYDEFKAEFSRDIRKANTVLKAFITKPSYTPPGAGTYFEDESTGEIWIHRDPTESLQTTLQFMGD